MISLPRRFKVTHPTSGLAGFGARDLFGAPGEVVRIGFACTVERVSGKPCARGGPRGGAYGLSLYFRAPDGSRYYATHLSSVRVAPMNRLAPGTPVGTVCDGARAGKPGSSHVHWGRKPP